MKRISKQGLAVLGITTLSVAGWSGRVIGEEAKPADKAESKNEAKEAAKPAEPLGVGTVAPDFALPDQDNKTHKLSDYKGKMVILAFYPADMTRGCTLQAHKLTEALNEFGKRNVQVFGLSVQDVKSKRQFCDKESIKYPLLADTEKKAATEYGVLNQRGLANRVSFIIGTDGKIAHVEREVKIPSHAQDLLAVVDKLQKSAANSELKK